MDYYKKERIKDWFRQHWKVLLGTGIFITVALVAMLIGFSMSGWDLIKWFQSVWAERFFICLAIGAIAYLVFLYIYFMLKKRQK